MKLEPKQMSPDDRLTWVDGNPKHLTYRETFYVQHILYLEEELKYQTEVAGGIEFDYYEEKKLHQKTIENTKRQEEKNCTTYHEDRLKFKAELEAEKEAHAKTKTELVKETQMRRMAQHARDCEAEEIYETKVRLGYTDIYESAPSLASTRMNELAKLKAEIAKLLNCNSSCNDCISCLSFFKAEALKDMKEFSDENAQLKVRDENAKLTKQVEKEIANHKETACWYEEDKLEIDTLRAENAKLKEIREGSVACNKLLDAENAKLRGLLESRPKFYSWREYPADISTCEGNEANQAQFDVWNQQVVDALGEK